jgi:hypothetical protein
MTLQPSTLAFTAGLFALVSALINIGGVANAVARPALPNLPITAASIRGFAITNAFIQVLFAVLSLVFSDDLIRTPLGIALCAGMAVYFGLRGVAFATSPEIRAGEPDIWTYVLFAAAVCYAAAAVWGCVI